MVVGYDVLNEPALANQFKDPFLILDQKKFDREVLSKFYKRFHDEINPAHQSMFFEPPYFPDTMNVEGGKVFNVGFEEAPGSNLTTQVLNDHSYCCQYGFFCGENDEIPLDMIPTCKENHRKMITTRVEDSKRLGVPFILPEFGACS